MRELVQLWASVVQIGGAPIQGLLRDRLGAERRDEWIDRPLDQVLIHAAPLVQLSKGGLHAVRESPALRLREAVYIDTAEAVHEHRRDRPSSGTSRHRRSPTAEAAC